MRELLYPIYPEVSGGAVVYRINDEKKLELLLIKRKMMGDTTIPKGHIEDGETLQECVLREVTEETGWKVQLESFIDNMTYQAINKDKQRAYWRNVYWFTALALEKNSKIMDEQEVEGVFWVGSSKVLSKMTRDNEKAIMERAIDIISKKSKTGLLKGH